MSLRLDFIDSKYGSFEARDDCDSVTVGKSPSVSLRIQNPSVSRIHCVFVKGEDGNWRVNDLGSKNGTFLNGERVKEITLVNSGVLISFGGDVLARAEIPKSTETYSPENVSREVRKIKEEREALTPPISQPPVVRPLARDVHPLLHTDSSAEILKALSVLEDRIIAQIEATTADLSQRVDANERDNDQNSKKDAVTAKNVEDLKMSLAELKVDFSFYRDGLRKKAAVFGLAITALLVAMFLISVAQEAERQSAINALFDTLGGSEGFGQVFGALILGFLSASGLAMNSASEDGSKSGNRAVRTRVPRQIDPIERERSRSQSIAMDWEAEDRGVRGIERDRNRMGDSGRFDR